MDDSTKLKLIAQLKIHEQSGKVALTPYRCSKNKLTIGWGHNFQENPLLPDIAKYLSINGCITTIMADRQLLYDINMAITLAESRCKVFEKLSNVRQAVIVNMIFNLGPGFLTPGKHFWPDFNTHLNNLDYNSVSEEMRDTKWYHQLGGDPIGTDDHILERPEELILQMKTNQWQRKY